MPLRSKIFYAASVTTLIIGSSALLTGCSAGAPANDQSSPEKLATSYFSDIEHKDVDKLLALGDEKASAAQIKSMQESVSLLKDSPYSDFKIASVKKIWDEGDSDHRATVYYTYQHNDKLVKGSLDVKTDPEVDGKKWMLANSEPTDEYGIKADEGDAVQPVTNTLTANGKSIKVTKNTLIFPGVVYTQKATFPNGMFTPITRTDCIDLPNVSESLCKESTAGGKAVMAAIQKVVDKHIADYVAACAKKIPGSKSAEGSQAFDCVGGLTYTDHGANGGILRDVQSTDAYLSARDTYRKAGNYAKFVSNPTGIKLAYNDDEGEDISNVTDDDFEVLLTGGAFQGYDLVDTPTDVCSYKVANINDCLVYAPSISSFAQKWVQRSFNGTHIIFDAAGNISTENSYYYAPYDDGNGYNDDEGF
jgi:hypothetical protein